MEDDPSQAPGILNYNVLLILVSNNVLRNSYHKVPYANYAT